MLSKSSIPDFPIIKHKMKQEKTSVKCRMLKTITTATDDSGTKSINRIAGAIYNISPALAQKLIKAGFAEEFTEIKPQEQPELKPVETKLIEKAKELVKPGRKNVDIAKELGISVKELKELKKELKK